MVKRTIVALMFIAGTFIVGSACTEQQAQQIVTKIQERQAEIREQQVPPKKRGELTAEDYRRIAAYVRQWEINAVIRWVAALSQPSQHPFLVCTRAHESDTAGGYRAVSPGGTYRGAYQFLPSTWNSTASHAGRHDLVGVDPAAASVADQDAMAMHLFQWQGKSPWGGRC